MNYSKRTFLFVSLFVASWAFSMEKQKVNYHEKVMKNKYDCFLEYESTPDILWPVCWSLSTVNENMNISAPSFDNKNKKQALLVALNYLYLKLAKNKFDVRYLEKVMQGNYKNQKLIFVQSDNIPERFTKSTLTINNDYSKKVTITQHLRATDNKVKLRVISDILPKLNPDDQEKYKHRLLALAGDVFGPGLKPETGVRLHIRLDGFEEVVQRFIKKIAINELLEKRLNGQTEQKNEEEDIAIQPVDEYVKTYDSQVSEKTGLKPFQKNNNFLNSSLGLSLGLNIGLAVRYILRDYFQENPKFTIPLLSISTIFGGLGGYYIMPKIFNRRK